MKNFLLSLATTAALSAPFMAAPAHAAQGDATFVTVNTNITTNTRWTRDKVYILTRMIFVHNNATLTIEPGTIVRGARKGPAGTDLLREPGTLVISRTGKIVANGTPDDPIIFTSIDDPNVPGGIQTVPKTFRNSRGRVKTVSLRPYGPGGPLRTNGFAYCEEWGGVVILGRAFVAQGVGIGPVSPARVINDNGLVTNDQTFKGADVIEGIDATNVPNTSGAGSAKLGVYGGKNDNDNSGVMRFCSVRYCGDVIGESNELNSITMGGMGDGTMMEHVEVTFNTDDGFEWFGGKTDSRFLFSLYNRDDAFDGDEGIRITGQFWTCVQGSDVIQRSGGFTGPGATALTGHNLNSTGGNFYNQLMEFDGPEPDNSGELPTTKVDVYNFTYIGAGLTGGATEGAIRYRLGATGSLYNGVCEAFAGVPALSISSCATPYNLTVDRLTVVGGGGFGFNAPVTGGGNNQFTAVSNSGQESTSQVRAKAPLQKATAPGTGVDIRLAPGSVARTLDAGASTPVTPGREFVAARYRGALRDNTHLQGWSQLVGLEVLPVSHPARLSIILGLSGSNPTITFNKGPDYIGDEEPNVSLRTLFVVERSLDGRTWIPVKTAIDGAAGDDNANPGVITVTDTETTVSTTPVRYRAYAL